MSAAWCSASVTPRELAAAYADLAARLGPRALVCQAVPAGVELALGIVRDPELGPLVVVGAGECWSSCWPIGPWRCRPCPRPSLAKCWLTCGCASYSTGSAARQPADLDAVVAAIRGLSQLAIELGDQLEALDINPLICGPDGAIAVDALAIPRKADAAVASSRRR